MTSAKSLTKTAVLDASDDPKDQDKARERRVKMDFASWRKQTKSGKKTHQEEVGISSAVAMKKAREEAKRKLIQDKAVAKQKAAFGDSEKSVKEAKVDKGLDDEGKEDARNYRKFGTKHNQHKTAVFRRELHRSRRGDKKIKGKKVPVEMEAKELWNIVTDMMEGGETINGKFMSYATMKAKGIKPKQTAVQKVKSDIEKRHGKGAIYDPKNPPKAKPKPKAKPDTRTDAQKKADQHTANMDAVYGGKQRDRGLGT